MNHVFRHEVASTLDTLFDNCFTFNEYLSRIERLSVNSHNQFFCNHALEALVEHLINTKGILANYEPTSGCDNDIRVAGTGLDKNGNKASVGVFYTKDPLSPLHNSKCHLSGFFGNSTSHFGVKTDGKMLFFSNADSFDANSYKLFVTDVNKVNFLLILRKTIQTFIDNSVPFWESFKKALKTNVQKPTLKSPIQKVILRRHQNEAVSACLSTLKGYVIQPTGSGKSYEEVEIIRRIVKSNPKAVCIIVTPRISLTRQLIETASNHLFSHKIDAKYLNLNSGSMDDDELKRIMNEVGLPVRDTPSTTSPQELYQHYLQAQKENVPLVIGATYQSLPKMLDTGIPIEVLIFDESHNLVHGTGRFSNDAKDQAHKVPSKRTYSFTATRSFTTSTEASGMNNPLLFGECIYSCSPRTMIEAGEIVPPYIHEVKIDNLTIKGKNIRVTNTDGSIIQNDDIEHNTNLASLVVVEAFKQHQKCVKEHAHNIDGTPCPDKIGAKLLVVCKGEDAFQGFFSENNDIINEFRRDNPNVKFFGISSESGAYIINRIEPPQGGWHREIFMTTLKALPDNEDAIIFHIDMLGEGMDVPGITGVMSFREMGEIKTHQTVGRSMRLHTEDRKNLYNGNIQLPEQNTISKQMIKPCCWIVVPVYSGDQTDMRAKIVELAQRIKREFGYMPLEFANNGASSGRKEQLDKGSYTGFGLTPEQLDLLHRIEEPDFMDLANEIIEKELRGEPVVYPQGVLDNIKQQNRKYKEIRTSTTR